uniref:UPAR/Ly6 domain-containing protein n=1 Tax=Mastacembelus armatus TaxID=205130 RepID=A0A7N9AXB9_9TELE
MKEHFIFLIILSLTCNTCDVAILGFCLRDTPVNCTENQNRCYTAVASKFSAHFMDVYERGCIEESKCKNSTGDILTVTYTITSTCCSTNLCNGATSIQLPLTAALCAALLALWSQWDL